MYFQAPIPELLSPKHKIQTQLIIDQEYNYSIFYKLIMFEYK